LSRRGVLRLAAQPPPRALSLHARPLAYRFSSSSTTPGAEGTAEPKPDEAEPKPEAAAEAEAAGEEVTLSETEQLEERIKELESEAEKKHDQLLRVMADAENIKRRASIDVANSKKFAIEKFAKSLLDVADNLQRAADSVPEELRAAEDQQALRSLFDGVVMTDAVLQKTFSEHGLMQMSPMGEKFDPNMHEALFDMPDAEKEPGTISFVSTAGYVLNDRCLRAAQVGITRKP